MYYVIKRHPEATPSEYISFGVKKYISNKNNNTVIFELDVNGKIVRKWVKKEDIILLTEDKEYFMKVLQQFKSVEEMQKKLVAQAQAELEKSKETYSETMLGEIDKFEELRDSDALPQVIKDI